MVLYEYDIMEALIVNDLNEREKRAMKMKEQARKNKR